MLRLYTIHVFNRATADSPRVTNGPWAWLSLVVLLAMAGCATGEYSMIVTVAGGDKVRVPLGSGGVVHTEEDGIRIESSVLLPTTDKKEAYYDFSFSDAQTRTLQNVRVEDITDEAPILLVEDNKPALVKGRWHAESRRFDSDNDGAIKWVLQLDKSVRVYRFTVVFAGGKKVVLNQGEIYPDFMKAGVRHLFGEKY